MKFRAGDRVLVKKGALICWGGTPSEYRAGKTYTVTIEKVRQDWSIYGDVVMWRGARCYMKWTSVENVERIPTPLEALAGAARD